MTRAFLFTLATLATLGLASNALAVDPVAGEKPPRPEMGKDFKKMDHEKRHAEMFAKTDKNGDGVLSKDEFVESHKERALKAFDMLDTNKDGSLSKEELQEGRKHWRKKMHEGGHFKGKFEKPEGGKPPRE